MVDTRRGRIADSRLPSTFGGPRTVCLSHRLTGERDNRIGVEQSGSGTSYSLAESYQKRHAARCPIKSRCRYGPGRAGRQALAQLLHLSWDAYRVGVTNSAWHNALTKAGLTDFRFHDLRHTWASWHRQAGTSVDELKDLGGWKSRTMVDRYAKYATEHLTVAAARMSRPSGTRREQRCHVFVTFQNRKGLD